MKAVLKALLARTPYQVMRRVEANRFQAIESCLRSLRARGYRPRLVVDGGAHLGEFSLMAKRLFPDAALHLIEPQQACIDPLRRLCAAEGFVLHACALAEQSGTLRFARTHEPSTGAQVAAPDNADTTDVTACTLDELLGGAVGPDHRALLKLDLQGYELHALKGGAGLLRSIEVVLTEVSFFMQSHASTIAALLAFMDEAGFQLDDIASLSARPRDNRAREGDFVFVRRDSPLAQDRRWE